MKLEAFFENFELLADAPNGVQKLRELILQLAVMGKLVPQDPNDEPASVLLEKIRSEKELLVKEGKIKKEKLCSPIELDKIPSEVPKGWAVERLGNLVIEFQNGISTRKSEKGVPIPVIRLADIKNGQKLSKDSLREISLTDNEKYKYKVNQGDILVIRVNGSAELVGRFVPCLINEEWAYCDHLIRVQIPVNLFNYEYLCLFGSGNEARQHLIDKTITTAGQKTINQAGLASLIVWVPPLAEQKRIVAKVDELMALCDRLSERQQKRRSTRITINNAAIGQLLTAREPEVFNKSWQHICNNFDLLYSTPDNIAKLRACILQLAVQGKLVPQDPNDEPASVLLEKIKFEKERLVKEGKSSQSKPLLPIKPEEFSFMPPLGWSWERFGQIADIVSGVTKGRNLVGRKTAFYKYLRVANVQRGFLDLEVIKEIEIPVEELEKYRLQIGDILLTEGGDWDKLGRSAIWEGQIEDCIHQNHIFRARPIHIGFTSQWAVLYTNSLVGREYFETASKKTTNLASINMTQLRHCPIPIPPVNEQKRIVAKVDQLMFLCDELETKLTQSVTDSEKLMEAAVRQILAANSNKTDKHESATLETKAAGRRNKKTQGQDAESVQLNLPLF